MCLLARLNIPAAALVTSQKTEREREKQMYKKHVKFYYFIVSQIISQL